MWSVFNTEFSELRTLKITILQMYNRIFKCKINSFNWISNAFANVCEVKTSYLQIILLLKFPKSLILLRYSRQNTKWLYEISLL